MKKSRISLLLTLFVLCAGLTAQKITNNLNSKGAYATGAPIENEKAASLDATFQEINLSNLNVESAMVKEGEPYLLEGTKIAGSYLDLFPAKFRRWGRRADTEVFAAAAIKGDGENLYIVRFVKGDKERIELFDLEGETMIHRKTLAAYDCKPGNCKEMESFLSDVNQDGRIDVVRIYRKVGKNDRLIRSNREVYLMTTEGDFERSKMELSPTLSNSFRFES